MPEQNYGRGSDEEPKKPADRLASFPSIRRPSANRERNRGTFSYRLSELIFGSLLASYLLGFIAFVSITVLPASTYRFVAKDPEKLVYDVAGKELTMRTLAEVFKLETTDQGLHVNLLLKIMQTPAILIVLQQLSISVLYAAFTALLYVNFHQSILYLSTDQRKSALDFILAMAIGVCFGLSSIFPLSTLFWLAVLTLLVFRRRHTLVQTYINYVALRIGGEWGLRSEGGEPGDDRQHKRDVEGQIGPMVRARLDSSTHEVVRSWIGPVGGLGKLVPILTIAIAVVLFLSELAYGPPFERGAVQLVMLVALNTILCFTLIIYLARRLWIATELMPSQQGDDDDKRLDGEVDRLLEPLKVAPIGRGA